MKSIFIILSIAVMIQISLAGSIERTKRSETGSKIRTQEDFVVFKKRVEEFITKAETTVLDIIEKLEAKLDDKSKCTECEAFQIFLRMVNKHKTENFCSYDVVLYFKDPLVEIDSDLTQPPKAYNLFEEHGYSLQELLDEKNAIEKEFAMFWRNDIRDC